MPQSITIPEVDDTTASWLVAEAGRRGVSVETIAGQLLHSTLAIQESILYRQGTSGQALS